MNLGIWRVFPLFLLTAASLAALPVASQAETSALSGEASRLGTGLLAGASALALVDQVRDSGFDSPFVTQFALSGGPVGPAPGTWTYGVLEHSEFLLRYQGTSVVATNDGHAVTLARDGHRSYGWSAFGVVQPVLESSFALSGLNSLAFDYFVGGSGQPVDAHGFQLFLFLDRDGNGLADSRLMFVIPSTMTGTVGWATVRVGDETPLTLYGEPSATKPLAQHKADPALAQAMVTEIRLQALATPYAAGTPPSVASHDEYSSPGFYSASYFAAAPVWSSGPLMVDNFHAYTTPAGQSAGGGFVVDAGQDFTVPVDLFSQDGADGTTLGNLYIQDAANGDYARYYLYSDLDNDGVSDRSEANCGANPLDSASTCADYDGDGIANAADTHPNDRDGDNDCLLDGSEDDKGNSYDAADSDGDGLQDAGEDTDCSGARNGSETDAHDADTDNDGFDDKAEKLAGTNPRDATDYPSDSDSLADDWERENFGDLTQTPDGDADGDGLSNEDEETRGTNPNDADTDFDLASDGEEVNAGTDPLNPDSDADGILDGLEPFVNQLPSVVDSDGDGFDDRIEIALKSDPNDADSTPNAVLLALIASTAAEAQENATDAAGFVNQTVLATAAFIQSQAETALASANATVMQALADAQAALDQAHADADGLANQAQSDIAAARDEGNRSVSENSTAAVEQGFSWLRFLLDTLRVPDPIAVLFTQECNLLVPTSWIGNANQWNGEACGDQSGSDVAAEHGVNPSNPVPGGVPEAPETPEVPESPEIPEAPEALDAPEVPDVPDAPEVPETPEAPTPEAVQAMATQAIHDALADQECSTSLVYVCNTNESGMLGLGVKIHVGPLTMRL